MAADARRRRLFATLGASLMLMLPLTSVAAMPAGAARPSSSDSSVCVDAPPAAFVCVYQRDWATAGVYVDPGGRSEKFHRIHFYVDRFHVPHEAAQTVLTLNVETCGRPDLSKPEPRFSSRCQASLYIKEIDNSDFQVDTNGARLSTKFGDQPIELEWLPEETSPPPVPGRIFTEVWGAGVDAEFRTPATATAVRVGDYTDCATWGEFGIGVEEGHLLERQLMEIMPGQRPPKKFSILGLRGSEEGAAHCGDPTDTLRKIAEATRPYEYTTEPGGIMGIHLIEPKLKTEGASYVAMKIDDDSGFPTYGTLLFDRNRDLYAEERHMFCGETARPIRQPHQETYKVLEIQEGPCMYPRVEVGRATTGTFTLIMYR